MNKDNKNKGKRKGKNKDNKNKGNNGIYVVTVRVRDMLYEPVKSKMTTCHDCGELVWISNQWEKEKIDKIICKECYLKNKPLDSKTKVKEETLQEALRHAKKIGIRTTKEEMLNIAEKEFGEKIEIEYDDKWWPVTWRKKLD